MMANNVNIRHSPKEIRVDPFPAAVVRLDPPRYFNLIG
jgi:hypothetical protein